MSQDDIIKKFGFDASKHFPDIWGKLYSQYKFPFELNESLKKRGSYLSKDGLWKKMSSWYTDKANFDKEIWNNYSAAIIAKEFNTMINSIHDNKPLDKTQLNSILGKYIDADTLEKKLWVPYKSLQAVQSKIKQGVLIDKETLYNQVKNGLSRDEFESAIWKTYLQQQLSRVTADVNKTLLTGKVMNEAELWAKYKPFMSAEKFKKVVWSPFSISLKIDELSKKGLTDKEALDWALLISIHKYGNHTRIYY